MIVIASIPGQLGNRLILYSSVIAWCIQHNQKLINPSFAPYDKYFESKETISILCKHKLWGNFKFSYIAARISWLSKNKIPRIHCIWIDWNQEINLDDPYIEKKIISKKTIFIQGWKFRANNSLEKERVRVKNFFSLKPKFRQSLDDFWLKNRNNSDMFIGVHIRLGDYAKFEGGKYFYNNEIYLKSMLECIQCYSERKIRFIVCSNENIDLSFFLDSKFDVATGPGHEVLDMYTLSECDLIIGPPSTYTMWASFYGNVPLYMIKDPNRKIDLSDFKIQETF